MPQPRFDLGGAPAAPPLHLAPANGFVPACYVPMLRPLQAAYRCFSLPPRALWGDGLPPPQEAARDWGHIAEDLLAALDAELGERPVIAIGHSFGGVASMLAVIQQPARFRALILLDPTFLPMHILTMMHDLREAGIADQHPLAQGALKRRRSFASREAAYARFKERALFADWDDEALRLYCEQGLVPDVAGGYTLAWPPEWEAYYFSTGYPTTWEELPRLNDVPVPTLIMQGATSDTFLTSDYERAQNMVLDAQFEQVAGHGHLFPQSAPAETATRIQAWLQAQGLWPSA